MRYQKAFSLKNPPTIAESIDSEVVLINLDTGSYYNITGVAASLWEVLVSGSSFEEIANHYGWSDDERKRVAEFVDYAVMENLIFETSVADVPNNLKPDFDLGDAILCIQKFTDMQEILGLDPIHQADGEAGWPNKA